MDRETYERVRAELWTRVFANVMAHRTGFPDAAAELADRAVVRFDKRFQVAKPTAMGMS